MLQKKILFLLLPLVFHAEAVEIYNEGQSSEASWFKDWRKPIVKHPASNNPNTISNVKPALPENLDASSTSAPLAIKKTNSYIVGPWGTTEIEPSSTPAQILALINTSPAPPPTVGSEGRLVEIKPRRRTFNFGSPEASPKQTETKWIPTYSSQASEPIPSSTPLAIIKEEKQGLETKPIHRSFSFGPSEAPPSETKWIPIYSSQHPSEVSEPQPSSTLPTIIKEEKPGLETKPIHRSFSFGPSEAPPSETKWIPIYSSQHPSEVSEPQPSSTLPTIIKEEKPNIETRPKHRSEKYLLNPKSTTHGLEIKPDFKANELSLASPLAPIEKSPGFIVYRYHDDPMISTTLLPLEGLEDYLASQSSPQEYKCDVKNGFYEVVSNCDKFVECKNKVLKLYKCSNGYHFNRNAVWPSDPCDEPSRAKCKVNEIAQEHEHELQPQPQPKPKPAPKFSAILISSRLDYRCPSNNGFYRFENDCEKFIKCENNLPATFKCLPGFKFNSYAIWGQDPCSADVQCKTVIIRPEPERKFSATLVMELPNYSCPRNEGYFSSENDCEQFIKCEKSLATLYKCAPGLQFNRYASWIHDPCDKESTVRCKAVVVQPPLPEPKMAASLILARVSGYSCPAANGYYRLGNDCEKFIKCENSIASSYKCNPGLQFNTYALWGADPCAAPEIVRCKTVIIHPNLDPIISAELVIRAYNFSCPASEGYYSTETDCDQFYMCKDSLASLYKCSNGLQFNRYASWGQDPCASEKEVRCQAMVVQPPPEPKFSAELIIRQFADYKCPSSEGYFSLGNDCDKFIKCEKSVPSSYKCWSGLQFNNNAAWGEDPCASQSIIGCRAVVEPKPTPPPPPFSAKVISRVFDFVCPTNNGYFDSKNECEQFIKCENAVASLYKCLPGLQFNRHSAWGEDPCASEAIVRCQPIVVPPPKPKFSADLVSRSMWEYVCESNNGYFKLGNDCDKFVKCENSQASSYKCWSGLQFNNNAVWGEDPCAGESIIGCRAVVEPKPTPPPPPPFSAKIISRVFDFVCPTNNGYFDSKNECEQFIKCENAVASLYKCLPGLQFNRHSAWGEDPCASEAIVRCQPIVVPPPKPKFSADLVSRSMWEYVCESNNGYFKLGNDCDKFVKCENSQASSYKCWSGLQFNNNAAWGEDPCASESIIGCRAVIEPKPTPPPPPFSAKIISRVFDFVCPTNNGYFDSKNECEQFIKCENAVASLYKCLPGLQFNRHSAWGEDPCASEAIVRCQPIVVPPPKPKFSADLVSRYMWEYVCESNNGYFKLGNDCDKFVKCENSQASSYKCWSGLQFNPHAAWGQDPCASENIVGCKAFIEPKPTPAPPKFSAKIISRVFDFVCPTNNGYFDSKNECEQFIKCENAVASLYKCLPGLQFNRHSAWGEDPCASEAIVRCQPIVVPPPKPKFSADLVSRYMWEYVCESNNGYFKLGNDCDKFVKCENSQASSYKCWSGLQFNPHAAWGQDPCASESIVGCKAFIEPKPTPAPPKFSAEIISRVFDFVCPTNNGYFDSKNECEQFIKCENAVASLYKCLPGLQFNRKSAWGEDPCASEAIVRCQPVVVPPPKPKFSADLVLRHMWAYNCENSNGYFKLDDDCEKFVKCENSLASTYKCWSGLQFNARAAWGQDPCASESVIGCKAVIIPPTTPKPKYSAILIASPIEDYRCTEANEYFSIDNSCERFVECKMYVPSLYMCRNGMQFNNRARFGEDPCASASIVLCEVRTTTTTTTTTTTSTTTTPAPVLSYTLLMRQVYGYTCSAANGYFSVRNECAQFIECKNYMPSLYRCNSGLHFNRNAIWGSNPCAIPSIARCDSALKKPPGPIDHHESYQCPAKDGLYPLDNFECSKYLMCQRGKATIMPCPPGLVFNSDLQACDWPVNVPSCNPEVFHGFSCPAPESDVDGNHSDNIIKFKYEDSCSQYIACQQGRPRFLSCDLGLSFSEESQACVSAERVPSCRRPEIKK